MNSKSSSSSGYSSRSSSGSSSSGTSRNYVLKEVETLLRRKKKHLKNTLWSSRSNQSLYLFSSPRFISKGFNSIERLLERLIDENEPLSGFNPKGDF